MLHRLIATIAPMDAPGVRSQAELQRQSCAFDVELLLSDMADMVGTLARKILRQPSNVDRT
jgi:hypothetical protein